VFEERNSFGIHGGMGRMGEVMQRGLVLVLVLVMGVGYDKYYANLPLDGVWPVGADGGV